MLFQTTSDDWQLQLISLFCWVDDGFKFRGWSWFCERFSNNSEPDFTDAEVLTCYLFARLRGLHQYKQTWRLISDFVADYFPRLPCYASFVDRIHRLLGVIEHALGELCSSSPHSEHVDYVIDSMPIILAKGPRAARAKVAQGVAQKSYCATKQIWYYGVKLHVLARRQVGQMPTPFAMGLTPAQEHDILALKRWSKGLTQGKVFADKAYVSEELASQLQAQGSQLCTPQKKTKGVSQLPGKDVRHMEVSQVRQPIEVFFAWLQEKTQIQNASKVRSLKGLLTFIWSSLLVALLLFP